MGPRKKLIVHTSEPQVQARLLIWVQFPQMQAPCYPLQKWARHKSLKCHRNISMLHASDSPQPASSQTSVLPKSCKHYWRSLLPDPSYPLPLERWRCKQDREAEVRGSKLCNERPESPCSHAHAPMSWVPQAQNALMSAQPCQVSNRGQRMTWEDGSGEHSVGGRLMKWFINHCRKKRTSG